jgi:hypothetical protein
LVIFCFLFPHYFALFFSQYIPFPPLSSSVVDQILRFRGFSDQQARTLAAQLGHSLTTIHNVPLKQSEAFIENAVEVLQGFYRHCCRENFEVNFNPRHLIGAACCSMFHQCLLSKNLFIHDRLGFFLDYQSELVRYALELLPVQRYDPFQRDYQFEERTEEHGTEEHGTEEHGTEEHGTEEYGTD